MRFDEPGSPATAVDRQHGCGHCKTPDAAASAQYRPLWRRLVTRDNSCIVPSEHFADEGPCTLVAGGDAADPRGDRENAKTAPDRLPEHGLVGIHRGYGPRQGRPAR